MRVPRKTRRRTALLLTPEAIVSLPPSLYSVRSTAATSVFDGGVFESAPPPRLSAKVPSTCNTPSDGGASSQDSTGRLERRGGSAIAAGPSAGLPQQQRERRKHRPVDLVTAAPAGQEIKGFGGAAACPTLWPRNYN